MKGRSELLTALEAARMAGCCATFIHNRARAGAFRSQREAGRVFIERESFLEWLELYQVRRHNPSVAETVTA